MTQRARKRKRARARLSDGESARERERERDRAHARAREIRRERVKAREVCVVKRTSTQRLAPSDPGNPSLTLSFLRGRSLL